MNFRAAFGLCAIALTMIATPAAAKFYQCVAYAREASGVTIRGNANTWWGQAEGKYARGKAPKPGAILSFKSMRGMPMGHVAVVAKVVGDRELLLDHANWSRRGKVERGVRAIDVSPEGDWSQVRVWFAGIGDLGKRVNYANGFIYPDRAIETAPVQYAAAKPKSDRGSLLSRDVVQMAMVEAR